MLDSDDSETCPKYCRYCKAVAGAGIVLPLIVLVACSQKQLTKPGSMVRETNTEGALHRQFLGIVEGKSVTGFSREEQLLGALNDARNKVAELGGDAMRIVAEGVGWAGNVQAEAYDCGMVPR